MKLSLFSTLRGYRKEYLPKDIFSGIIIAAVSIPISMGYAQISGISAVYGLYGSVLPILLFLYFPLQDSAPPTMAAGAASTPKINCLEVEKSANSRLSLVYNRKYFSEKDVTI